MEKKLTVKSNFYEQEDVVNVQTEEVDELINEEIDEGNIAVGTKLYEHKLNGITWYQGCTVYIISPQKTPLTALTNIVNFAFISGFMIGGGVQTRIPILGFTADGKVYYVGSNTPVGSSGTFTSDTVTPIKGGY